MPTIQKFKDDQHDGAREFTALVEKRIAETGEDPRTARLAVVKTAEGREAYAKGGGYSAPDPSVRKAAELVPPVAAPDSAQGKFDALVAKHAAIAKVDERTARLAVVATAEGRALYAEAELDKRDAALAKRAR